MSTTVTRQPDHSSSKGNLTISISSHNPDSIRIPKHLELLNSSLKIISSIWVHRDNATMSDIESGTYVVRVSVPAGISKEEIVIIDAGKRNTVNVELGSLSPHESHEWAYFNKSNNRRPKFLVTDRLASENYLSVNVHEEFMVGKPEVPNMFVKNNIPVDQSGDSIELETKSENCMLAFSGQGFPKLYVGAPPSSNIKCLIRLNPSGDNNVHPLDVTIATENQEVEALLALLNSGDIASARTLWNAEQAEQMLYSKMRDPVGAVIGGYFLLKIDQLERLHDWTNNLANLFPEIPDASIIHAWHVMKTDFGYKMDRAIVRQRLLASLHAGMPVYTEGLRLLLEGLTLLHYNNARDKQVKNAMNTVRRYYNACDLSKEITTITIDNLLPHDFDNFGLGDMGIGKLSTGVYFLNTRKKNDNFRQDNYSEVY